MKRVAFLLIITVLNFTVAKSQIKALTNGSATYNTVTLYPAFAGGSDTRGSRYIFDSWGEGFVVNAKDTVIKDPSYFYNYDKMEGKLLLSQDKKSAIEIDKDQIKSFNIYTDAQTPLVYEKMDDIDKDHFALLLSSGNKYKIYKLTKTKFVKANFHTDGIASTGNDYNEYVDENTYYSYNVAIKQLQKISLKRKSLKDSFGDSVNEFLKQHEQDAVNDAFLKDLGDFVNKP